MMQFSLDQGLSVTSHVLAQDLAGESVLLNIQTEEYFGLDDVGTHMWQTLIEKESIETAIATLQTEYDVEPTLLQHDVETLIDELLTHGLVELIAA
ncbi:PqqD family protein [Leptothoe sp. LEGE 181152]|nr:PqqD family protein [Leptothoe sp. LEGE 181152]